MAGWSRRLLFLPPALLLFTLFVFLPLLEGAWYSGYKWSGYGAPTDWVGTRNFEVLSRNSTFQRSFNNTLIFVGVGDPVCRSRSAWRWR